MSARKTEKPNTYEALLILKPIMDADNSDAVLKGLESWIEAQGGHVMRKDKQGRKRLAYEINDFKDAFVTVMLFTLPSNFVGAFRKMCQHNEDILRLMLVNRPEGLNSPEYQQQQHQPHHQQQQDRPRAFAPRRPRRVV